MRVPSPNGPMQCSTSQKRVREMRPPGSSSSPLDSRQATQSTMRSVFHHRCPATCGVPPSPGWGVPEYVIRTTPDQKWPAFHRDRMEAVLSPQSFGCQAAEGWGDFRLTCGDTSLAFAGEMNGWQVVAEGTMCGGRRLGSACLDRDKADRARSRRAVRIGPLRLNGYPLPALGSAWRKDSDWLKGQSESLLIPRTYRGIPGMEMNRLGLVCTLNWTFTPRRMTANLAFAPAKPRTAVRFRPPPPDCP